MDSPSYRTNGGTSFVGPQLNGVTALLAQYTEQRLGLWNPLLYDIAAAVWVTVENPHHLVL
jgi:subtilase family serine protease